MPRNQAANLVRDMTNGYSVKSRRPAAAGRQLSHVSPAGIAGGSRGIGRCVAQLDVKDLEMALRRHCSAVASTRPAEMASTSRW